MEYEHLLLANTPSSYDLGQWRHQGGTRDKAGSSAARAGGPWRPGALFPLPLQQSCGLRRMQHGRNEPLPGGSPLETQPTDSQWWGCEARLPQ